MDTLRDWLDAHRDSYPTTDRFSEAIGVSASLLRAWRYSERTPTPERRDQMIRAFGLGPEQAAELRRLCDEADRERRTKVATRKAGQ